MNDQIKLIQIFLASPGDVGEERKVVDNIIKDMLPNLIKHHKTTINLIKWETHTYAALGRPQGVINAQIDSYDIFVGIMWNRFGTPTGESGSGTEEEFRRAYASWESTDSPHVMFYFCSDPMPEATIEAYEQKIKVEKFKKELSKKGLTFSYEKTEFQSLFRKQIENVVVSKFIKTEEQPAAKNTSEFKYLLEPYVKWILNQHEKLQIIGIEGRRQVNSVPFFLNSCS
jgi:hypothetical protein